MNANTLVSNPPHAAGKKSLDCYAKNGWIDLTMLNGSLDGLIGLMDSFGALLTAL